MTTLLLAEVANGALGEVTARALSAALGLGAPVDVLVAGQNVSAAAQAAAKLEGVAKVRVADDALYAHGLAEPRAALLVSLAKDYDAIVAPSTASGKNVAPRVAALLDVMQVSDVTKVLGPKTFERPIYAGNAIQTVEATDPKIVMTVRTASFAAAGQGRPAPVADKLGAAMGASRAAVDAGYAPNDWQVGQTGKVVAPELYIAVGISGAIQHLAGMKDSKVIVAINKDEEAPIFQVADYGLVADLYQALPELAAELDKVKH